MQVLHGTVASTSQQTTDEIAAFVRLVTPSAGPYYLSYGTTKPTINEAVTSQAALIERTMSLNASDRQVWVSPAAYTSATGGRKNENVRALKALRIDVDVKPKFYETKEAALAGIRALADRGVIPAPSAIVDSGNGWHVYWALTVEVTPEVYVGVSGRLKAWITAVDPKLTADTSRWTDPNGLLRLPGTANRKDGGSKHVLLIELGRAYDLSEFDALPAVAGGYTAPATSKTVQAAPKPPTMATIPPHIQARMAGKPMKTVGFIPIEPVEVRAASPFAAKDVKFDPTRRESCFRYATMLAYHESFGELSKDDGLALYLEHAALDPKFGTGNCTVADNEKLYQDARTHVAKPLSPDKAPVTFASVVKAAEHHGQLAFTSAQIAMVVGSQRAAMPADVDDEGELLIYPSERTFDPKQATPYIVKGLVLPGKTSYVYAAPGAAKTFFVIEMVYAAAVEALRHSKFGAAITKARFFGRYIEPAAVLVVALEDRDSVVGQRAEVLRKKHGDAGKFFAVLGVAGRLNRAEGGPGEFAIIRAARRQMRDTGAAQQVIVIDTLAQAMNGDDENSGMDAGAVRDRMARIVAATGAAMVVVHHSGKNPTLGARGHSSLLGAADIMIKIEVLSPKDAEPVNGQRIRRVWIEKAKNEACGVPWTDFTLKVHDLGHDRDGDPVTSCTCEPLTAATMPASQPAEPPKLKARAAGALTSLKDLMNEAPANGAGPGLRKVIGVDDWRNDVVGHATGAIRETKAKQFRRAIVDLEQAGAVGLTDDKSKVWINAPWGQK